MPKLGTIIFLHGSSSTGKSALAKELLNIMDEPYEHASIRKSIYEILKLHSSTTEKICMQALTIYESSMLGIPWESSKHEKLFDNVRNEYDFLWHEAVSHLHQNLVNKASNGINVIIEGILVSSNSYEPIIEALHKQNVLFVKLYCSFKEIERREKTRDKRANGWAKSHFHKMHNYNGYAKNYDLEIDTSENNTKKYAMKIKKFIEKSSKFTAITKNFERIKGNQ